MKISNILTAVICALTAIGVANAYSFGMPENGHFSIQSYGSGWNPVSSQSITSVSYSQPGYTSGFYRDGYSGISFGGVSSRQVSGGYAWNNGFSSASIKSPLVTGGVYRSGGVYRTGTNTYGGSVTIGKKGIYDNYPWNERTVYGNSYGKPYSRPYGYDRLGSSY